MAQHEQDREDLLREATALTTRAELQVPGFAESIVVGFRSNGAASIFIGADPVYQFNTSNELRRGFRDGQLMKAVDGKLFTMRRQRCDGQVQLLRSELGDEDAAEYLKTCREHLAALQARLAAENYELVGEVPRDGKVVAEIVEWLAALPQQISIATQPNVQ